MRLLEGLLAKVMEEVLCKMHRRKNQFPSTIHLLPNENYYIFMFKLNESAILTVEIVQELGLKEMEEGGRQLSQI